MKVSDEVSRPTSSISPSPLEQANVVDVPSHVRANYGAIGSVVPSSPPSDARHQQLIKPTGRMARAAVVVSLKDGVPYNRINKQLPFLSGR